MNLDDLLLAGLREGAELAALEGLSPEEWRRLADLARRHGVMPLLHHRLAPGERALAIPPDVAAALRQAYLGNAARNLRLYQDLGHVLRALGERDVPAIVLKGPHLAQLVYRNVALRSMGDIDILVPRDHLAAAMDELRKLGYRQYHDRCVVPDRPVVHHLPPMVKAGATTIELHWTLVYPMDPMARGAGPLDVDLEEVWRLAEEATLANSRTRVLGAGHLLVHLSMHFAYHHRLGAGLKTACDIAALLESRPAEAWDWQAVAETARRWHAQRCVSLTLALARDLIGARVPDEALSLVAPSGVEPSVVDQARRVVLELTPTTSARVSRVLEADRLTKRLSGLLTVLVPTRELMAAMYPAPADSWRILLYYPVRVKDLLVRHGFRLWGLARRDQQAMAWADHERRANALVDWLSGRD